MPRIFIESSADAERYARRLEAKIGDELKSRGIVDEDEIREFVIDYDAGGGYITEFDDAEAAARSYEDGVDWRDYPFLSEFYEHGKDSEYKNWVRDVIAGAIHFVDLDIPGVDEVFYYVDVDDVDDALREENERGYAEARKYDEMFDALMDKLEGALEKAGMTIENQHGDPNHFDIEFYDSDGDLAGSFKFRMKDHSYRSGAGASAGFSAPDFEVVLKKDDKLADKMDEMDEVIKDIIDARDEYMDDY